MTKSNGLFTSLISDSIQQALEKRQLEAAAIYIEPGNSRSYKCSSQNCSRSAYAKGLCNAHYIRSRAGKDMNAPLRARKRDDACCVCGEKTGAKGGWGMCPAHYKKERHRVVKQTLVDLFGGKCRDCGGSFHLAAFDFHHLGSKEDSPSKVISGMSPEQIANEISKCVLLCANCHRVEHAV